MDCMNKSFQWSPKKRGNRKSVKLKCQIIRLLMSMLLITREASKISLCLLSNWACVRAVHVQWVCCTKCQIILASYQAGSSCICKGKLSSPNRKVQNRKLQHKEQVVITPRYSFIKSIASLEDRFHWKRLYLKSSGTSRLKCFNIFVKFIHFT